MHILPRLRCLSLLQQIHPLSLSHLKQIHAQLLINSLKSTPVLAQLLQLYCAISTPQTTKNARLLFTHFENPNVYLLNVLIRCSNPRDSIIDFANWVSKNGLKIDDFTFVFVLGACARSCSVSALWEGKQIHGQALKLGLLFNIMVQTTAIHFYASNKCVCSAEKMFEEMPVRSIVTWNAMIKGYCSQKVKAGEHAHKALLLFKDLLTDVNGVKPTDTSMVCVLSAASQLGVLVIASNVHGYVEKTIPNPENDVYIGTGLVDMYSKCGCLKSAFYIFERLKEKNVLTWTSMVTGLTVHGKGKQALILLDDMKISGVKPNEVTFTSLLSGCSYAGLVEEGLCLFYNMEHKFGVRRSIQHYGCVVDLLGRAGLLKEAYKFIEDMKIEADVVLWRNLLNACKVHGDVEMSEKVGKILLGSREEQKFVELMDPSEDYIALSNTYASVERWGDVEMVRERMKMKGIQTIPGCSSIQS